MIQTILLISYVVGVLAIIHATTRQPSAWAHADRQRGWWLTLLIMFTVFGLGLIVGLIYLVGVVPMFVGDANATSPFTKR